MKLTELPWRTIRRVSHGIRKTFFATPKPDAKTIVVEKDITELEDILLNEHFSHWNEFSYYYMGEDGNYRRPDFVDDKYENYQTHIRLFKLDDSKTEIMAHFELCPLEYPRGHLNGVNFSWEKGLEEAKSIMREYKIDYEEKK